MTRIPVRLPMGILLVSVGQTLILVHSLPFAGYYFPLVWYGYILTLDGTLGVIGGTSIWASARVAFLTLIPVSAGFWWLFELFDQAVHNWRYVGAGAFSGLGYAAFATLCFSTVLLAVGETAMVVSWAWDNLTRDGGSDRNSNARSEGRGSKPGVVSADLPCGASWSPSPESRSPRGSRPAARNKLLALSFSAGIVCIVLPVLFPRYAFGLIWGSLFLIIDPVNAFMGRPSLIVDALAGRFARAIVFATSGLICGFFWEFWNYWAAIKWVYNVPYVSQLHLFEMPLPGYLGYLPFGLEVFAVSAFSLGLLASARRGAAFVGLVSAPHAREPAAVRQ